MAKALKITLVKSVIGATPKQKKIAKVSHLLDVEEL